VGAFHFFWRFFALGRISAIQTFENWSLSMGHLSCRQYRPEGTGRNRRLAQIHHAGGVLPARRIAVLVDECNQLCRILGKSIATAKAARRPGPGGESGKAPPITNNKSSMTNSQSRSPKS
jgi:hypothetical protein